MAASEWFGPTLRMSGVSITRDELERRLGRAVDRFETAKSDLHFYAQINPALEGDLWANILAFVDETGANLQDLLRTSAITTANLDLGLFFNEGAVNVSADIPSSVAVGLGLVGINITVSVYLTSDAS